GLQTQRPLVLKVALPFTSRRSNTLNKVPNRVLVGRMVSHPPRSVRSIGLIPCQWICSCLESCLEATLSETRRGLAERPTACTNRSPWLPNLGYQGGRPLVSWPIEERP